VVHLTVERPASARCRFYPGPTKVRSTDANSSYRYRLTVVAVRIQDKACVGDTQLHRLSIDLFLEGE
jgi:uncharacterized protein YdhG (YjbR/CyaY superfamily)